MKKFKHHFSIKGQIIVVTLSLFLCSSINGFGQKNKLAIKAAKELKKTIPGQIEKAGIPGAAIAVIDNDKILWSETYGKLGESSIQNIDLNTIFSIQSMSKSFTALAVLMAVQDGLLDLDTPIKEYIPDFNVNSIFDENPIEKITLRHLLAHRAGFTHDAAFGSNSDNRYDFEKHIESISESWLRYPAGYRNAYSNLGIDLAAWIIQVQSGKTFEEYMEEKVLEPLGMNNTYIDMKKIENIENRAIGHTDDDIKIPLYIPMIGAGGIYTCINDMTKYAEFHINKGVVNGKRILRKDLIEKMHSLTYPVNKQRSGYCFGFLREAVSNTYEIYHSGGGYGFFSDMIFYPELGFGVVLLTNSVNGFNVGYWHLRNPIAEIIEKHLGDTPVDEPGYDKMIKVDDNDPRVMKKIGRYGRETGEDGYFSIEFVNDTIGIRYLWWDQFYPLSFYDDNGELVGFYGNFSEIRFLPDYNSRKGSMTTVNRRIGTMFFHLYDINDSPNDPPGPNKKEWQKYIGEYEEFEYEQPEDTSEISIKNGYLYFEDRKCWEYKPGFFFTHDNEVLNFNSNPPSIRNLPLRKID